jgi:hypothetical protein
MYFILILLVDFDGLFVRVAGWFGSPLTGSAWTERNFLGRETGGIQYLLGLITKRFPLGARLAVRQL